MDSARDRFERLVGPLQGELRFMARAIARQESDALDLVQETLIKAWRSFGSFVPGTNFKAWIFTILRHAYLDLCRSRRLQPASLDPALDLPGPLPTPDPSTIADVLPDDLLQALRTLPPAHQVLILLCDHQGLRYREIADVLGCPIGSVMSGIHNARGRLKEALKKEAPRRG